MSLIKSRKHATPRSGARPLAITSLVTSIALGLPVAAAAQPASAAVEPQTLPTIVVTGQRNGYKVDQVASPKFTQPLLDTPQTISVISSQLIEQQGAATLAEALRNSPGVGTFYVGENGSTATGDAIYMRGFDSSGSIFVDGVRDLGAISRDVFDVEQVEVTKGPDGTEYGRTAPSGAINMVSKQATLDHHSRGALTWGSANRRRATADWNQPLGQHSALRLNLMGQQSGVAGREQVRNDRWGISPSLAFGLGTPLTLQLDYLHVHQNNVPDGGVSSIGLPGYSSPDPTRPFLADAPRVDTSNFYGTDADHDRADADMFTALLSREFENGVALHQTLRWGRTEQNYLLTSFMGDATRLLTPDPTDLSTWTIERNLPTFKDQTNRILTSQTNVTTSFATGAIGHDLSGGIELTREQLATGGTGALAGSTWPAANLYAPNPHVSGLRIGDTGAWSRGRTDTAAAYLFDTLSFGKHWLATAGLRVDHYRTEYASVVPCGSSRRAPVCGTRPNGTPLPAVDASKSGTLPGYKFGLVYKPVENASLYANLAAAAEPPGGNALALSNSANSADNPAFDPARARTIEIGGKWNVLNNQLRWTAALYRTTVTHLVVQDPVDLQYYQVGRQRVQGVELGVVGQVTRRLALSAGYTLMDAQVTRGNDVAQDGSDALPYTPRHAFTAWASWQLPGHLSVGAGARHAGELRRGRDGAAGTPAFTKGYWVADAMASYAFNRQLSLQLNLYNLTDQRYVAAINKSGYRYTPGTPRSAQLTLNLNY